MLKMIQDQFGGGEVMRLEEVADPVPGADEALVRVEAIGVNPADWKRRQGLLPHFPPPPFTVGLDFAGRVVSGGEEQGLGPGEAVFGCVLPPRGTYATHLLVPLDAVAPSPASLRATETAALPIAGLTALQPLVSIADVQPGQRVLVHAASGGVGHLAVQIAKARGAQVIATGRTVNHDFLRGLGADRVVDYREPGFFDQLIGTVDVVFDPISGENGLRSLSLLDPGGILIDVRASGAERDEIRRRAEARGVRYVEFRVRPAAEDLRRLGELVEAGALLPHVEAVFPLAEAAAAHAASEAGHTRGKLVLVPPAGEVG